MTLWYGKTKMNGAEPEKTQPFWFFWALLFRSSVSSKTEAQAVTYTYGNQTTLTVAGQLQSTTGYDGMNRAATIVYPQPGGPAIVGPFITQYDDDGRKTGQTDQAGKTTSYKVDGLGRTTQVTQMGNLTTYYTFDQVGNQLTQVDANTHKTTYTPDNMGRRRTRELPDGRTEHYTGYDATGNLTNKTDFANNGFTYGYTPLDDRLTSVSGPGIALTTGYDGFLRRYSMTDLSGQTTFNYDARDRMTKQTSPSGWGAFTFTYLYGGQVNTVSSSNEYGNNLTYEYDSLNRPSAIQDGSNTTMITYDSIGNISQIILSNGVAVTYVYDNLNRLTAVKALLTSNSSFLTDFEYTLGPTGNRLNVTEITGRAVTWTPDDLYRLTGENIAVDPSGNTGNVTYTYDSVGNRNQRTSTVSPIVSQNFTGAYTTADLLKPTFDFDQNGNQLTNGNGVTYTYNALNQLTRVQGTGLDVSYVYDGDGLRVQKTASGVITNYLWDRNNLTGYPQVSEELQNGSVVRRYVYGPKGPLYMVQLVGSAWVTSYFGEDATGSVRFLIDGSGTITDSYTCDAFGNVLSRTGTTSNAMLFDGEYADSDTGLVYLRARWYDPTAGRFLQMDSYEGNLQDPLSVHKYIFGSNNPMDRKDPGGNDDDCMDVMAEEPEVLWPGLASSNPGLFITFSGFNVVNFFGGNSISTAMQDFATRAPGLLGIPPDNSRYFRYTSIQGAENFIAQKQNQAGKSLKVILVGHSLGASAADVLAGELKYNPNIKVAGLYYIDGVGYSPYSSPGSDTYTSLLSAAQAPHINPGDIPSNVKNFGNVFQRNPYSTYLTVPFYGINTFSYSNSTKVQFSYSQDQDTHTNIDGDQSVQADIISGAKEAYSQ